ncbi:hypothetical protein SAMD00019534_086290 [Acytostelium subglobosum LB1]|uniref:hypothetical protein n=1 Tax=Acytostelium subglobosum LB1 TaxID=1410327 RepID=UPI000644BC8F|nr:hypothetical protein SAMD00019534_086290 [Acytostelium subglobosum LB1]GAM25454.1 hypothetical protein SAMD00019534_086290 [Acytostelium subglobosum LB1]|eukprot:XP_012751440.1 hypothetical protein SAMD00019534_086290 [Acytostelium subglobosum LB1]
MSMSGTSIVNAKPKYIINNNNDNHKVGIHIRPIANVSCEQPATSFYDLEFPLLNGTNVHFSQFKNKVVLLLNTASF